MINVDIKCVTPQVGHTDIWQTDRVTNGGEFKSCSMQLKIFNDKSPTKLVVVVLSCCG